MESEYLSTTVADGLRCTACGAEYDGSTSWRWCSQWEHRCEGAHPQAGYFPAEMHGDKAEHFLWQVDEGATWWVIATDENDALALVIEHEGLAGNDVVGDDWNDGGHWPTPQRITVADAKRLKVHCDDACVTRPMFEDFHRDPSRRFMACSEW